MADGSQRVYFNIDISEHEYIDYYRGKAKNVIVTTEDNRTIQFPARLLQQFVQHTGIKGRFRIIYSSENKLISIDRVK